MKANNNKFTYNMVHRFLGFGAISFMLLLVGCEMDATVKPPAFEKKPVVMSYISVKDSGIRVQIAYTQPYYGKLDAPIEYIRNAEVWVTDLLKKDSIKLNYQLWEESYWIDSAIFKVKSKREYALRVKFADGKTTVAYCKTPDVNRATNWQVVNWDFQTDTSNMWAPYSWRMSLQCNNPESGFYYQPLFSFYVEDIESPGDYSLLEGRTWADPATSLMGADGVVLPIVDRGRTYDPMPSPTGSPRKYKALSVELTSWVYDKYFQYHFLSQNSDSGNPFAEPVLLHGNFSGDVLGLFSAYDFNQISIVLP